MKKKTGNHNLNISRSRTRSGSGYIKPKITAVDLDPSQAILQACQVGGIFMASPAPGTAVCVITGAAGTSQACVWTSKGTVTNPGATTDRQSTSTFPS